jgi:plastocyanin
VRRSRSRLRYGGRAHDLDAAPPSLKHVAHATAALAVAAALMTACGSGDDVPLVEGVVAQVDVVDNSFRPESIEVAAGTEIEWTNLGRSTHDVLPVEGDDWGVPSDAFEPEAVYRHRFTEPGTYAYYCSLHGTTTKGMVGSIVVTG